MKWTSIAAAVLSSSLGTLANAAEPGFYVTATVGTASEDPESNGINLANSGGIIHLDPDQVDVGDGEFAWSVGLGYRINDYLAGEVEYVDFGKSDVHEHYTVPNTGPIFFPGELDVNYSSKVTGPVLSVLGTFPVGPNFELFLRGGALFASRERQQDGQITLNGQLPKIASTVWLAGAGVSWSFGKRWGVRAEYQRTGELDESIFMGATKLERVSLSALYRF